MRNTQKNNLPNNTKNSRLIGSHLIEANLITQDNLSEALEEQKISKEKIGDILVRQGNIKQKTLDYFVEKIIKQERSENIQQDFVSEPTNTEFNAYPEALDRVTKTLNLPILELSSKKVSRLLLIIVFCLIFAGFIVSSNALFIEQSASATYAARLFTLNEENNFPTLYSSLALLFCSILLAIISYLKKEINSAYAGYWKALSLIFLYLAIDEISSIHEIFNFLRPLLNAKGLLYFAWVIPGIIFTAIFLLIFRRFIQSLPPKTRNLFIMAGTIYVGSAIGIEMIGAYYAELHGQNNFMYSLLTIFEESLEMLGIVIFIYALLSYIAQYLRAVNLQISFHQNKKS